MPGAAPAERMSSSRAVRDTSSIGVLVSLLASAASASLVATGPAALEAAARQPATFASFVALTVLLQVIAVDVYGRGRISVAGIGLLATGFTFGIGAAMATAVLTAVVHAAQSRPKPHRALFNAATFALSAGAAAATYQLVDQLPHGRFGGAVLGGVVFWAVNIGLLTFAISISRGSPFLAVWRELFQWLTAHYLAFGPLALASTIAYEKVGLTGLVAFVLPPALLAISIGQYLKRTRAAVEEVRQANEELRMANVELAERNADLQELFQFAGGLAAHSHDRDELVAYGERAMGMLVGAEARIASRTEESGIPLLAAGTRVGSLELEPGSAFDERRWERLRDAILPQLATAVESADLIERVRRQHLATIAALSRSIEAKDYYTGGHTERVSAVAVAIATRLGYSGGDLHAIEIGALLHDIGKIGVPEAILQKPGPLDEDEWKVMREHPVISEYILSGIDLSPIVLEIARSSHERIDGKGYPDGLHGDEIPLPARIVLVADALDALTSDRPYRRGRNVRGALEELRAHAGTQFCPIVVDALEHVHREEPQTLGALHVVAVDAA